MKASSTERTQERTNYLNPKTEERNQNKGKDKLVRWCKWKFQDIWDTVKRTNLRLMVKEQQISS